MSSLFLWEMFFLHFSNVVQWRCTRYVLRDPHHLVQGWALSWTNELSFPRNCWDQRSLPSACLMVRLKIMTLRANRGLVPSHVEEAGGTTRSWCAERSRAEGWGQRGDSGSSNSWGPLDHYPCHSLFKSTIHPSLLSTSLVGNQERSDCLMYLKGFVVRTNARHIVGTQHILVDYS